MGQFRFANALWQDEKIRWQPELPPAGGYRREDRGRLRSEDGGPEHGPARELPDRPGRQDRPRDRHAERRHPFERDERSGGEAQQTLTSDSPQLRLAFNEQPQPPAQSSKAAGTRAPHPPTSNLALFKAGPGPNTPAAGTKSRCRANGERN